MNKFIVSIDGPAGSGKEKISKYISKKYKLFHLDSGILYRRLAFEIIKNKINYKNINILKKFLNKFSYLSPHNHKNLRKEEISKKSSRIAKLSIIRKFVNRQQKNIVKNKLKLFKGCVIDGRDIGSIVFKNAKIKLFIEVNAKIRAKRRHKQLIELGEKSIYSDILREINMRDSNDINRKDSPLVKTSKTIIIDNSENFKQTIYQINKAFNSIK